MFADKRLPLFIAALLVAVAHTATAQTDRYVNLNTWPLDPEYRAITAYPDDPYTWDLLGFVEGATCPPYLRRDFDDSQATWRDANIPIEQDWAQASQASRWVACYRNHRGTDIFAPAGAPVYAAGDGTVISARLTKAAEYGVTIHHRRLLDDGLYFEWEARYLHLTSDLMVGRGEEVVEGQLLGYLSDLDGNSHLHFEMVSVEGDLDIVDCEECIINPWGPVWLWVDDDFDGQIDPAAEALPPAPFGVDLLAGREPTGRWVVTGVLPAGAFLDVWGGGTVRIHPVGQPDAALRCEGRLRGTLPVTWRSLIVEAERAPRVTLHHPDAPERRMPLSCDDTPSG